MNDETKQDQQQQGAAREVGGAAVGEPVVSPVPYVTGTDSLPAAQASSPADARSAPPSSIASESDSTVLLGTDAPAVAPTGENLLPASGGSNPSASDAGSTITDVPAADYANGLKCSWLGKSTSDMSRDELIAFVGMLDDYATRLANAARGEGSDSQTEQLTAAHPIHAVLGELESEIERPGAILKARVKSLINDARALF